MSLGGAYAAGGTELVFENSATGSGTARFIQRPVFNALISALYFAGIGRQGHRLHFQAGFAIPLSEDGLEQRGGTPGSIPKSRYFTVQPPGGPIVATGISFGIGRF